MPQSTMSITFTLDLPESSGISFLFHNIGTLNVSMTADGSPTAMFVANYVNTNFPTLMLASVVSNKVTITSLTEGGSFSGGAIQGTDPHLAHFIYNNATPLFLTVSGLNQDRYLINNEIWATIKTVNPVAYYTIYFENLTTGRTTKNFIVSPNINNEAKINLSPVIKGFFSNSMRSTDNSTVGQIIPNANKVKMYVTAEDSTLSLTKTFVRGGNRTTLTNQTLSSGQILRPTVKLPVWSGFETAEYYLDNNDQIIKRLLADVNPAVVDYRRSKGCDVIYFEFLNQQGGYSSWLFDTSDNTEASSNLGGIIIDNEVNDLGNEVSNKYKVYGKIPKEYIALIKDLSISSEIYALINGAWVRLRSGKNNIVEDPQKRSYNVSMNFDVDNRFNPSPLWSN